MKKFFCGPIAIRSPNNEDIMKKLARKIARSLGVDLVRYNPAKSESARIQALMRGFGMDLVLDVGANTGQFAAKIRGDGYRGKIVSFEPLSSAHDELKRNAEKDPDWIVAPRVAIGEQEGETEINVAGNSASSSILPMLDTHLDAAPESRFVASEKTRVARLDSIAWEYAEAADSIFLKIDTQGYEAQVLKGAEKILRKVDIIQIELSLVPLYAGQMLMRDMLDELSLSGFELFDFMPTFFDPATGRLLQIDGVFTAERR